MSSTPPPARYTDDIDELNIEEDIQEQAALTRNDDPIAQQPVSREDEAFEDLESGVAADRER